MRADLATRGDASACGNIRFLVELQRKPHPIGVMINQGAAVLAMGCERQLGFQPAIINVKTPHMDSSRQRHADNRQMDKIKGKRIQQKTESSFL